MSTYVKMNFKMSPLVRGWDNLFPFKYELIENSVIIQLIQQQTDKLPEIFKDTYFKAYLIQVLPSRYNAIVHSSYVVHPIQ